MNNSIPPTQSTITKQNKICILTQFLRLSTKLVHSDPDHNIKRGPPESKIRLKSSIVPKSHNVPFNGVRLYGTEYNN